MSRRSANRARLMSAGAAALSADAWISGPSRDAALSAELGERDIRIVVSLADQPRIAARQGGHAAALIELFCAQPKLAPWLASPAALVRLIRFTGAGLEGAPMTSVVHRDDVSHLVGALGEDVWRFGLDVAGTAANQRDDAEPGSAEIDPDHILAAIEAEGCAAVYGALEDARPGLATAVFTSAGLIEAIPPPPSRSLSDADRDEARDKARRMLTTVTERVLP